MCDVLMVSFWVWAVVLWVEGMEHNSLWRLAGSALLVALAALTKHFGISLIPLLAVYSSISQRQSGRWALCLLIPLATLTIYQWITSLLYGRGLLLDAGHRAATFKETYGYAVLPDAFTALTFAGGCLASAVFFAPLLWRARMLAGFAIGTILPAAVLFLEGAHFKKYTSIPASFQPLVEVQIVFWAIGGVCILAMAVADFTYRRTPHTWLLMLWVLGTFFFTSLFNWVINGRSILPMAPAVGILLARRLERCPSANVKKRALALPVCLALGALLALLVTRADFLLALAVRQSAQQTYVRYGHQPQTLWFEGHWGFQYYLEALGASALDIKRSLVKPGDHLAIPYNNTNLLLPDPNKVTLRETLTVPGPGWLATWNETMGAGFYASVGGPLPFAFGPVPPEGVAVFDFGSQPPVPAQNSK
jgi:hypothetical protein